MVARDLELEMMIVITTSAQRVGSIFILMASFMADTIKDGVGMEGRE